MKGNFVLFFLIWFVALCCGEKKIASDSKQPTEFETTTRKNYKKFEPGKIISLVSCQGDNRFNYALYLPASYNEKEKFPAIIFFDPHAKATLPLEKYRQLSDRFRYILIASCESKNGLQAGIYPDIYNALRTELSTQFKIQSDRIYCAGFSGGARVAINVGLADESVAGVIANSAGFEPSRSPIKKDFVFAGIAGNEDFNLLEQIRTDHSLDAFPVSHLLIEFDGKHEWAPEKSMERAFIFLEADAKSRGKIVCNESALNTYVKNEITGYKKIISETDRYQKLKLLLPLIDDIQKKKQLTDELQTLNTTPGVLRFLKKAEEQNARESVMQNMYYRHLFTQSLNWWKSEIKQINEQKSDKEKFQMNQRLKSYISLVTYMTISSPEAKQDVVILEKLIEIYSLVDPENPEWAYQRALLRASQGNISEAELFLKTSIELGFQDKERFFAQKEFAVLHANQGLLSMFK